MSSKTPGGKLRQYPLCPFKKKNKTKKLLLLGKQGKMDFLFLFQNSDDRGFEVDILHIFLKTILMNGVLLVKQHSDWRDFFYLHWNSSASPFLQLF